MIKRPVILSLLFLMPVLAAAQQYGQLDPSPYTPGVDADIGPYVTNWRESSEVITHGTLIEQAVFTRGDQLDPPGEGAVLKHLNRYSHAILRSGTQTAPVTLDDAQEVFYVAAGTGELVTDTRHIPLSRGISVLIPPGIAFTLRADSTSDLDMYLVSEPLPADFTPNTQIMIADENTAPYETSTVHWAMVFKRVFSQAHGLATIQSIIIVTFAPMTMGQPHSHDSGCEETWLALEGDQQTLLGKQLIDLPPGHAFMIPPDGNTPHATINLSDEPVKLFHVARYRDLRKDRYVTDSMLHPYRRGHLVPLPGAE